MDVGELLARDPALAALGRRARAEPGMPFPVLAAKIKLTWRCNLRCGVCGIWRKGAAGKGEGELPAALVRQTLEALRRQGLLKVHFSGGEVFLRGDIREVLLHARGLGLQVNLTTNGTLLDKEAARFLVEERIHGVTVSIDSADERQHDRMRGSKGVWRRSWEGIERLLDRRRRKGRGPTVAVNTVITARNLPGLGRLHGMLAERGVDRWRLLPVDTDRSALRPTAAQWQALAADWESWRGLAPRFPVDWGSERSASRAAKGRYAGEFYREHACYAPWFNLFVDADGRAYPCCMGKSRVAAYGDIHTTPVAALLESAGRREARGTMSAGATYEVCRSCDDFLEENRAFSACCEGGEPP